MIGIAVFVLTFQCYGPGCGGVDRPQSVVTRSQQTCELMRDLLKHYPSADRVVDADCHGESRALTSEELNAGPSIPLR